MTSTIESTHKNILNKIDAILEIISIFNDNNINISQKIQNITLIQNEYEMNSINILSNYFLIVNLIKKNKNDKLEIKKKEYYDDYKKFIKEGNFVPNMNRIIDAIKEKIEKVTNDESLKKIYLLLDKFNESSIKYKVNEFIYDICSCYNKMIIDSNINKLVCSKCGYTKEIYDVVHEDENINEVQKNKYSVYDSSRHCKSWVDRIQAREAVDIPECLIKKLKNFIKRDNIKNIEKISCLQIRDYLRESKFSKYNENVPLIKKIITGVTPPQLTDYEIQLIHVYFDKVINIFDEIKPPTKTNCPYHPYFIYKIIQQIMNKENERSRRNKILSYIHLQSRETLINNDKIFREICKKIPEFSYTPTDKNEILYT